MPKIPLPFQITSRLEAFFVLFTLTRILHFDRFSIPIQVIGLVVLAYPKLFYFFLPIQLYYILIPLPDTAMNYYLLFFTSVILITFFLLSLFKTNNKELALNKAEPYLLFLLINTYFFAGLAKANADYFNPEYSCAVEFYNKLAKTFFQSPFRVPLELKTLSIWASIILEILLSGFLVFRKTRNLALIIGIFFHFFLSFGGHFRLSSTIFSIYFLFIPDSVISTFIKKPVFRAISIFAFVSLLLIYIFVNPPGQPLIRHEQLSNAFLLLVFLFFWCVFWSTLFQHWHKTNKKIIFYFRPLKVQNKIAFTIFCLLMAFYSLSPYIGFKTIGVFTMYSNLRIEPERSNHFFIPLNTSDFLNYAKDIVYVEEIRAEENKWAGTISTLYLIRAKNYRVPLYELQRVANTHKQKGLPQISIPITYTYKNQKYTSDLLSDSLFNVEPRFLDKFLNFRPIPQFKNCYF